MMNLMPCDYITKEPEPVRNQDDLEFNNYDLLVVDKYEFPPDSLYPSIVTKAFEQ